MAKRIILPHRRGAVEGELDYLCAEPEIVLGELDGPVGMAMATLLGDQVKGHTKVFAILNSDVQIKPATLMVSKVTVSDSATRTSSWAPCRRPSPMAFSMRCGRATFPGKRRTNSASSTPSGSIRRS